MRKFYLILITGLLSVAIQTNAETEESVIGETPAGTLKSYYKTSVSAAGLFGSVLYQDFDGIAADVVFAEDGSVYIKNPFPTRATGTWLKGTLDGDTLTVTTPQPIYTREVDGELQTIYAMRMLEQKTDDGKTLVADTEKNDIKFVYSGDSLIMVTDTEGLILGAAYKNGLWDNVGDKNVVYSLMTDTPVAAPDPAAVKTGRYVISNSQDSWFADAAFTDDSVYIRNIFTGLPDAWIKGRIDGNRILFSGAYLGIYDNYHVYFCKKDINWDTFSYEAVFDDIAFNYDPETKNMSVDGEVMIDQGKKLITPVVTYSGTKLTFVSPDYVPASPKNPEIITFNEYDETLGYGYVEFNLPKFDINDNLLDVSRMYYNIFADDIKMTLYADEYDNLADDMTDIPYTYYDNTGILAKNTIRGLYYYFTGFAQLGIQSVYAGEDDVECKSDIVYVEVPSGINGISGAENAVSKITYTDMAGRKISKPANGLYIKTVTSADGTVRNTKVFIR